MRVRVSKCMCVSVCGVHSMLFVCYVFVCYVCVCVCHECVLRMCYVCVVCYLFVLHVCVCHVCVVLLVTTHDKYIHVCYSGV